jgi:hypothetical protein
MSGGYQVRRLREGVLWGLIEQERKVEELYGCSNGKPGIAKKDLYERGILKPEALRLEDMYQILYRHASLYFPDLKRGSTWQKFVSFRLAQDAVETMLTSYPEVVRIVRRKIKSPYTYLSSDNMNPDRVRELSTTGHTVLQGGVHEKYLGFMMFELRRGLSKRRVERLKTLILMNFNRNGVKFTKDNLYVKQHGERRGKSLLIIFEPHACKGLPDTPTTKT